MRITCLGTGTPEPHVRRASSGYLIEVADDVILFDCGGGVFDRLVQAGKRPSDLTHIFFSHLHTDHFIDYGRLLHAAWDEGKADIQVIGPAPVAQITERLFGRDGAYAHDLIARTELPQSQQVWLARGGALPRDWPKPVLTEVEPGFSWEGDGWRVTSCEVPHAQPFLTCMALRIDCHGRSFVFSGDAGRSKPLERLAEGADLLIHWLYALGSEESIQKSLKTISTRTKCA
ncbi:MAG: MBL fold metallo-hydrolase [Pseudomonadota bacterium]